MPPVLRVLQVFQPFDGGVPQHVADLVEGSVAAGVETVAAGPANAAVRGRLELAAPFVALPIVGAMAAPGEDARTLRRLSAVLRSGAFDVVHTHAQKGGLLGRLAARRAGVPSIYTPNSLVYRTQAVRPRPGARARFVLGRSVERALGRHTAAIVAVAEHERRTAIEDGLAPPERIHVINNGVHCDVRAEPDPRLTEFRGEGPLLGFMAGLRDQKGLPTLLDALEILAGGGQAPRFAIVGNGELLGYVEDRVRSTALRDTTLVLPFASAAEAYLSALDAYVLPSYWEGLPIAVLEAMALGVPVVATAVDGTPEAVEHGQTGLLVPSHDAQALADALSTIGGDAELRARMGARAREVALERFTVEEMVAKTLDLYRTTAPQPPPQESRPPGPRV